MTNLTKFNLDLSCLTSPNDDATTAMITLINQLPDHWSDRMATFLPDDLTPGADAYFSHDPEFILINPHLTEGDYENFWKHWNNHDVNVNDKVLLSILLHCIHNWSDDQESDFTEI